MGNQIFKNHLDSRDDLEDEIKRLETDDNYISRPQVNAPRLEEKKYTPASDEALGLQAERELDGYRKQGETAIREKRDSDEKSMLDMKEGYGANRDGELSKLEESYNSAVRATDADAIKRGLARSSVAAIGRAEIEKEYLAKNAEISATYGKKIAELDKEIAALDGKLKSALDDFNLSYATRLNERITELKSERDKKVADVAEYNNDIRAKQAQLDMQAAKTQSELYSAALEQKKKENSIENFSEEQRDAMYKSIYKLMDEYRKSGKSILMISEELPELIGMSDRILILKEGKVTKEFTRDKKLAESDVIRHMI